MCRRVFSFGAGRRPISSFKTTRTMSQQQHANNNQNQCYYSAKRPLSSGTASTNTNIGPQEDSSAAASISSPKRQRTHPIDSPWSIFCDLDGVLSDFEKEGPRDF